MEENIQSRLIALIDEEYKTAFMRDYPQKARPVVGIPMASLSELAREYACSNEWRQAVEELTDNTYEETLLKALITGFVHLSFDEAIEEVATLLPKIDSRQLCDALCLAFHVAVEHPDETLYFLEPYLTHGLPFEQRFAIVTLMDYFVKSDYIDRTLNLYARVHPTMHHVQDALAWGYLICYMGFPEKTLDALRQSSLPSTVYNEMIERMSDAHRLSEAQRQTLLALKRNNLT